MYKLLHDLLYMTALALIPTIPAFLLFKALPTQAEATGPFAGLNIKLGGAFAGYFLIFLALAYLVPKPSGIDYYTVRGRLALGVDTTAPATAWSHLVQISIRPSYYTIERTGKFHVTFPIDPDSREGYPSILLETAKCGVARVPIPGDGNPVDVGDPNYKLEYHPWKHLIRVMEPVVLEPYPGKAATDTARLVCAGRT